VTTIQKSTAVKTSLATTGGPPRLVPIRFIPSPQVTWRSRDHRLTGHLTARQDGMWRRPSPPAGADRTARAGPLLRGACPAEGAACRQTRSLLRTYASPHSTAPSLFSLLHSTHGGRPSRRTSATGCRIFSCLSQRLTRVLKPQVDFGVAFQMRMRSSSTAPMLQTNPE
jgi:hypothetical protein